MNSMISTVSRKTCIARKANSRRVAMRAVRNGSRVCMMQTYGFMKKFECLSYLPPLSDEDVAKQIQYLLNQGWSPCIEFAAPEASEADQKVIMGPGYYDNRYYTMWKLPMFGCSDPQAVLNEIAECRKDYPNAVVRVIGFDSVAQVQKSGFVVQR